MNDKQNATHAIIFEKWMYIYMVPHSLPSFPFLDAFSSYFRAHLHLHEPVCLEA